LGDGLGAGENISSDEGELVGGLVILWIFWILRGVSNQFLECLSLAQELNQLRISRSALVDAVFVFS